MCIAVTHNVYFLLSCEDEVMYQNVQRNPAYKRTSIANSEEEKEEESQYMYARTN